MKYTLTAILLLATAVLGAQTALTIEGQTYSNSDDTWYGVNIARSQPTTLIFRNNSITSVNRYGYLLSAGDEVPGAYNSNLNGAIISGNMITWNGSPEIGIIPHGIFTGYNINVKVKHNYLNRVPMAIIRKSNGMTDLSGAVAYNIIKDPGIGVVVKGMNGVKIYNNTFYSALAAAQTNRALIDIYENPSVTPAGSATGTKIFNNIFYTKNNLKNISIAATCLSGFESDYNVFYCESGTPVFAVDGALKTFAQWQAMGYDRHSVVINPGFKDFINFVPATRLDYGTDLGSAWSEGLSVNARWGSISPETTLQNGKWQVGAVIHKEVIVTPPQVQIPAYSGSLINESTPARIDITFSLSLANVTPPVSAFTVMVNNVQRSVNSVSVSGVKVYLTLSNPIAYGDKITIAYAKPSSNPIQTPEGGQAATFSALSVTNNRTAPVNSPPVINLSSPTKSTGYTAPATITIDATTSDPDGSVVKVEFYNGTTRLGERTSAPWSFTWKDVKEGTYSFTAAATDNSNSRTVSAPVDVVVEKAAAAVNLVPSVAISTPSDNLYFEAPAEITLSSVATDPDGIVAKVEYSINGEKIGESITPPFSCTFKCDTAGTFEIIATAFDNLNATSISEPVTISLSLKREYSDHVNIYPTPNDGRFTVAFNSFPEITDDMNLSIISLNGNTVYSETIDSTETSKEINVNEALPGIYLISIADRGRVLAAKRFIKY